MSLAHDRERSGFRNRNYQLQYYSSAMALLWEKSLLTSYKDGHLSDVALVNGKVLVTSYLINKRTKVYYFYVQYMDRSGNWMGNPMMIDSLAADKIDENNKPGIIASPNNAFMAFSYFMVSRENKTQASRIVVMDTTLEIIYRKIVDIPYPTDFYNPLASLITNQGSFFILGIHYTTEKRVKEPDQSFYELYGYNILLDRFVNRSIKGGNKFLTDVGMTADGLNRSIVVAGFYSEKTTYSTGGVFYYSLTEDSLHETRTVHTPFSNDYLQKFLGERKESKELVNYSIDRLIVRKDGGVAIVAESMYQSTRSYFDYYMQSYISHYYYHFGNIMVLSVNPDGQILWNNIISKDQNSIDDSGYLSSYYLAVTGGQLVAIYNKYIEEESSVLVTYVEPTGNQMTDVVCNELEKVKIIPRSAKQIDDETVLMPAFRQNKFYIIQLTF